MTNMANIISAVKTYGGSNAARYIEFCKQLGQEWIAVKVPTADIWLEPETFAAMVNVATAKDGGIRYRFRPNNKQFAALMNTYEYRNIGTASEIDTSRDELRRAHKGAKLNRGIAIERACAGAAFNEQHALTSRPWWREADYIDAKGNGVQVKGYGGGFDASDLERLAC